MHSFHKRTMLSFFPNHEDAQAVENAVRTAIHTVVSVISSINSAKIQEYHRKLAEKDKENETLKRRVKQAEQEISELRGVFSGNECQARSNLYALSPEMARGEQHCNKNELAGKAEWRIDFSSIGAPPQDSSHCQNSAPPTGADIDMNHHQNITFHSVEQSVFSAVRSKGQPSSPSPVTSPMIKEEPSDIETFYIKWEMSDACVGEQHERPKHIQGKDKEPHHWGGAPTDGSQSVTCSQSRHEHGEWPTRHLKTGRLSSAETQRRFRERLRADPEKYRAYKEKERCRNQQRKVSISDLPEEIRRLKREAWREASRRCRARKMSSLQMNPTQLCHLSPEPPGGTEERFRGRQ